MTATAEQIAPSPALVVQIIADKAERGRKAVMVGGVRWGTIHMQSAGAHGAYYWFEQEGTRGEISRPCERYWKGSNRLTLRPVKVWGDKTAKRQAEIAARGTLEEHVAADNLPPLEARLITETRELIAEGLLRDPDVVQREREAARQINRKAEADREQKETAEFEAKARACLAALGDQIGDNAKAEVVAQIVAAMRWAQAK